MIFISYSSKNNDLAEKVNSLFVNSGLKTWFAQNSINTGENYAKDIVKAIQTSKCIVLLYTQDADHSIHIQKELDLALKYKKKIYPIRLQNSEPKEAMEYFLSGSQYFDVFENFDKRLQEFIERLKKEFNITEDRLSKLNDKTIFSFCADHFDEMGYTTTKINKNNFMKIPEVAKFLDTKSEYINDIAEYLSNNCFYAKQNDKQLIVQPIFLESSSLSYLKALEADLLWKSRKLVWDKPSLIQSLNSLGASENLINEDDIDFKLKSNLADKLRPYNTAIRNITILYYLIIKNPPTYKKLSYSIPLEGDYGDGETMPFLYLNYTFLPKWWGYKKDDIENIPGKKYIGFNAAFEKIRYSKLQHKNRAEYENYDGRIAETLTEVFLKRNDLIVQQFGAESLLGNSLAFMEKATTLEDTSASHTIKRFMTSPDLLVIKLNDNNQIINSFMVDVKFRTYDDKEMFQSQLLFDGELYNQAKKYNQNWSNVYLFLYAKFKNSNKIEIYFLQIEKILLGNYNPTILKDDQYFGWLDDKEIELLTQNATKYWLDQ